MTPTARAGQVVLVLLGAICTVVAVSVWFAADAEPFPRDANVLVSTFGAGMGLIVVLLALGLRSATTLYWAALWVLPGFFLSHVLLLGTWVPDAAFLVLAAAALVVTSPSRRTSAAEPKREDAPGPR